MSGRLFLIDWNHPRAWHHILEQPFDWDFARASLTRDHPDVQQAILINSKGPYDHGPKDPKTNKLLSWTLWETQNLTSAYQENRLIMLFVCLFPFRSINSESFQLPVIRRFRYRLSRIETMHVS